MKTMSLFLVAWCFVAASLLAQEAKTNSAANQTDRTVQPVVPQGKVTPGVFAESKIYPGTRRDYSVYVPAQYSADKPASMMVFMDGTGYAKVDGAFRIPVIFDNL